MHVHGSDTVAGAYFFSILMSITCKSPHAIRHQSSRFEMSGNAQMPSAVHVVLSLHTFHRMLLMSNSLFLRSLHAPRSVALSISWCQRIRRWRTTRCTRRMRRSTSSCDKVSPSHSWSRSQGANQPRPFYQQYPRGHVRLYVERRRAMSFLFAEAVCASSCGLPAWRAAHRARACGRLLLHVYTGPMYCPYGV